MGVLSEGKCEVGETAFVFDDKRRKEKIAEGIVRSFAQGRFLR